MSERQRQAIVPLISESKKKQLTESLVKDI